MRLRVALVCDLLEERWPSMDLVADMLMAHLPLVRPDLEVSALRPPMRRRATRVPLVGRTRTAFSIDRYSNRYGDYARWLGDRAARYAVFHVVDHSYAHLVSVLPGARTVVTCHDVDAFRCLAQPSGGGLYRSLAKRVLAGLRRAAVVTCDTHATREELASRRLIAAERLEVVYNGVHPAFLEPSNEASRREAERLLGPSNHLDVLHVGSTIQRKRIDVLLATVAALRRPHPGLRLVRVGGPLTPDQRALARSLAIDDIILELPFVAPAVLAEIYRRAVLTLLPSDVEGFGLPLIESMACGTPVLASRIPALEEVGADAAAYAPPGDPTAWQEAAANLLAERQQDPARWEARRDASRTRARAFSWLDYAGAMATLYTRLAGASGARVA